MGGFWFDFIGLPFWRNPTWLDWLQSNSRGSHQPKLFLVRRQRKKWWIHAGEFHLKTGRQHFISGTFVSCARQRVNECFWILG